MASHHRPTPRIVMTPPAQPAASSSSQQHSRRPPAHRSVSLIHSPRRRTSPPARDQSDSSSDDQGRTNSKGATDGKNSDGSPSSLQPLGRDSSGESSNAEKWFEKSNNEVRDSATFADNDPPFFMRHSSSSETPPEMQQQQMRNLLGGSNDASGSLPLRTGLLRLGTDGSSTEDYRGVIDDLTIENKKLKRRLKKYEKLHDSHLKDEKLFEVRIHGLPAAKKRELEETLRKFTASLGSDSFPASGYDGIVPTLPTSATNKTGTSSQTSLQNADSAYASMSGQGSSAAQSGGEAAQKRFAPNAALRRQNIHTYLHHIPEGLLPQPSPINMTERMKKKLVVRRLEQVFAGKGAVGGHHHPEQQQEVSHSAARADRAASEGAGRRTRQEGTREARIMRDRDGKHGLQPAHSNISPDESSTDERKWRVTGKRPADAISTKDASEQRPTRPLDLDPHRAQVPTENILYMRHLGFSPPDPETMVEAEDGHGWVYLNLLINMAQLHTINVTADFVRKAISEYSAKFELSHDERKVRWKGGASVTRGSSSGGNSSNSRAELDTPDRISPRKRPKLAHRHSAKSGANAVENSRLVYTPLFFHKDSTDDTEDSSEEEDDSMSSWPAPVAGDSSGMTSSGGKPTSSGKRQKRNDGPIIFYNNARFCTDLSGDRASNGLSNAPPYVTAISQPIGMSPVSTSGKAFEKRGPLADASELPEPMDLGDNPIPSSMELGFPARSPLSDEGKAAIKPVDLEVTGIGGVWPSDNFSIAVESRHARLDQEQAPSVSHEKPPRSLPYKFARILDEGGATRKTRAAVHKQVIATERRDLPPSQLPAALSYMPSSEESNEDESDAEDDVSVSPVSPGEFPPATAPQLVQLHYADSEDDDDDDGYESSDDGSLDLLAAAREIDPEAVREQEREYDANMAERLAEEIPAGSSAATAGGGSGFASPSSTMNRDDYEKAVKNSRSRQSLNRHQTTDSLKVNSAKAPAVESSSDKEDETMDDAE